MRDFVAAWDKVMNLDRFDLKRRWPSLTSVVPLPVRVTGSGTAVYRGASGSPERGLGLRHRAGRQPSAVQCATSPRSARAEGEAAADERERRLAHLRQVAQQPPTEGHGRVQGQAVRVGEQAASGCRRRSAAKMPSATKTCRPPRSSRAVPVRRDDGMS